MKNHPWIWILSVSLFGSLLYVQSVGFEYTLDDELYAKRNRVTSAGLENWTDLFRYGSMNFIDFGATNTGIYRPFSLLTFAVENELVGGFNPKVSHSVNVILYFAILVILGFLLEGLGKKRNLPFWFAPLVLLLFAIHPLHVEVVASSKSRDTLLSSFFAFSAILIWYKNQSNSKPLIWALVGTLFFFSLLSKEESLTLLAMVGLLSYFFLGKKMVPAVLSVLPFFVPSLLYLVIRIMVLDSSSVEYESVINSILYTAEGGERIATNFYIYLQYIKLLFFPHPLSWDYSFGQLTVQNFTNIWVWVSILFFAGLFWLAYRGFKNKSLLSFGLILYFATFSIFANLVPALTIGSNMGERFLFIPSLSFVFLLVFLLMQLGNRISSKNPILTLLLLLSPFLVGFTWKTLDYTKVWENNLSVTKYGISSSPGSWRTHTFYAINLAESAKKIKTENPDSAKSLFLEAKTEFGLVWKILGQTMYSTPFLSNYAELLINLGDSTQAYSFLEDIVSKKPRNFYPLFQLGRLSFDKGDLDAAEKYYLLAIKGQNPELGPSYKNLGMTYIRKGEKEKAIQALEKSLEYWDGEDIRRSLGYLYSELGQMEKASEYLVSSESENPQEKAFINSVLKGNEAYVKKNYRLAIEEYKKIEGMYDKVDGKTKFSTFYGVYGKSLLELGDTINAKINFLRAVSETDTRDPVVFTNLGTIAFLKDKNFSDAERYFLQAVNLGAPDKFSAYSNLGMAQLIQNKEKQAGESFEKALQFGSSRSVLGNLYLINKSLGNQEKVSYYQGLLNQSAKK